MNTLTKKGGEGGTPPPATQKSVPDTAPAWENPLIPNKKLRALYTAMVELRLLEAFVAKKRHSSRASTNPGEEGVRASTALDLKPSDRISDAANGVATSFLRGAKLTDLLLGPADDTRQLQLIADAAARLHLAMGAALTLKSAKQSPLVIAYVYPGDLALLQWKPVLRFAAAHTLPMVFVLLPSSTKTAKPGALSLAGDACGVPGIPVDAADPVALYRVAQESTLRARAGGGPVLMECIPFRLAAKKTTPGDPIVTMQQFMLQRRIVDEDWLHGVETRFAARLKAAAL